MSAAGGPAAGRPAAAAYDAIVVGLGGIGSAAAWQLAARGARVLGLDANARGHALGSSHGSSRITREAYPDGTAYVPLVRHAMAQWERIGEQTGRPVLHRVGSVAISPPGTHRIDGGLRSAAAFGIELHALGREQLMERFPAFRLPEGVTAVHEPGGGYLEPEAAVAAQLRLAAEAGAELRFGEEVTHWEADAGGDGVAVATATGTHRAARLVLAAGPWAPELLGGLGLPLRVERRVNVHVMPERPELFGPERLPVFNLVVPEGQFYGFPAMGAFGVKIGRHDVDAPCTPRTIRRRVDDVEAGELRAVLDRYVPGAAGRELARVTCMYTMTPDERFVVDRHPDHPQVAFFTGCSGHAFKFSPVLGEVLADLALDGRTAHEIGFLSAERFLGGAAPEAGPPPGASAPPAGARSAAPAAPEAGR